MIKKILIHTILLSVTGILNASVGLDYLNNLRTKTGLPAFTENTYLDTAAKNHADYMQTNTIYGHDEESANIGYTGDNSRERAVYAGYFSRVVSENISYGTATIQGSIDDLFSAIYHRFGFLNLSKDQVGIGISNNSLLYTYNMGNSILNDLCENNTYNGGSYYTNVCADSTKKIEASDYNSAADTIKSASNDLILWPSMNANDIPPVFYEETPDPLPSNSVSGYPVSVEFNSGSFSSAPTMVSFALKDASNTQLNDIVVMNHTNDPNTKFTSYQFALFPEKRLEWGSKHIAQLVYDHEGTQSTRTWCFSTRSLHGTTDKFYRIVNDTDSTLNAISGKSYALYVVPYDANDKLGSVSYSYTSDTPIVSYIDQNTISVKITGSTGSYAAFTFNNGQKIKLTIADSDTATVPAKEVCDTSTNTDTDGDGTPDIYDTDDDNDGVADASDAFPLDASESIDTDHDSIGNNADSDDDNDGISDVDEVANGLDPLNASDSQADFDGDGFSNTIEISVGTDIRNINSKPTWAPIMMGELLMFVPAAP